MFNFSTYSKPDEKFQPYIQDKCYKHYKPHSLCKTVHIWYDRLYKGHILFKDNPRFHKTKASCYICKFLVFNQEHKFDFFNILHLLLQISPLGNWILRKSANHTNLHNNTLYNNANLKRLGMIFDTGHIWKRRVK